MASRLSSKLPGSAGFWFVMIGTVFAVCGAVLSVNASPTGDPPQPYSCWLESELTSLYNEVSPAVVQVVSRRLQALPGGNPGDMRLRKFLVASGVVVGAHGCVVTTAGVVQPGDSIEVHFPDGKTMGAKYEGINPALNIAVLTLSGGDRFPFLTPAENGRDRLPEWVASVAYGPKQNNRLARPSLALSTRDAIETVPTSYGETKGILWRVRTTIAPGNSGGALVGLNGDWLGLITGVVTVKTGTGTETRHSNNTATQVGVIVPAGVVFSAIQEIVMPEKTSVGFLGVSTDQETALADGEAEVAGVIISGVLPDSPAARSGLAPGDRIVRFNSQPIKTAADLATSLDQTRPGALVRIQVERSDTFQSLELYLGDSDAAQLFLNKQERLNSTDSRLALRREISQLTRRLQLLTNRLRNYESADRTRNERPNP